MKLHIYRYLLVALTFVIMQIPLSSNATHVSDAAVNGTTAVSGVTADDRVADGYSVAPAKKKSGRSGSSTRKYVNWNS